MPEGTEYCDSRYDNPYADGKARRLYEIRQARQAELRRQQQAFREEQRRLERERKAQDRERRQAQADAIHGKAGEAGSPEAYVPTIGVVFQSQETVDRDYEGSWFYAMR